MKKKTLFDTHLYREGMRSLIPLGSIFLGLLSLFSVLFPVAETLNVDTANYNVLEAFITTAAMFSLIYFAIIVIVVPVLTLKTFSFLTTRNGSDFYHAIPHMKRCLYLSFAGAVFSWVAICSFLPMTIGYAVSVAAGLHGMSFLMFLNGLLHVLAAALLVMSGICIACAVTGTLLTNIITTGLILFFPRLFLYACRIILSTLTRGLTTSNSFFLGTRCNLVVQSFIGISDYQYYLFNVKPLIYTLILSVIYLSAAALLFERRHSELAMKSTLGRKLQAFFCLLFGTLASLIPIMMILYELCFQDSPFTANFFFYVFVSYVLIIIGMGVYELLTTKRIRNLVRILPRTGILALINIGLILVLFLGKRAVYSFQPDASEISSVSFAFTPPNGSELFSPGNTYYNLFSNSYDNIIWEESYERYFASKSDGYKTSDETAKEIIAAALKNPKKLNYADTLRLLVTINTGTLTYQRSITLPTEDFLTLRKILLADQTFTSIYTELPKTDAKNVSLSSNVSARFSHKEAYELYQTAKEELSTIGSENWIPAVSDASDSIASINFVASIKGSYKEDDIPINSTLPKTYQQFLRLISSKGKNTIKDFSAMASSADPENGSSRIYFDVYDLKTGIMNGQSCSIDSSLMQKPEVTALLNGLVPFESQEIDFTKQDTYLLEIYSYHYTDSGEERVDALEFLQIDEKTLDRLLTPVSQLQEQYEESLGY